MKRIKTGFLNELQRQNYNNFPEEISEENLIQYFLLSENDFSVIPRKSSSYSRLGFAITLCTLRYLGYIPEKLLDQIPAIIINFVAKQLKLDEVPNNFKLYGSRNQTKSEHLKIIIKHLQLNKFSKHYESTNFMVYMMSYALEHDRPTFLLEIAINKLRTDKIIRPTIITLERIIATVREKARLQIYHDLSVILNSNCKSKLDALLLTSDNRAITTMTWIKQRATSHSPESICITLEKIKFLESFGVNNWNLSHISVNRIKYLNNLGRCSTNQALQRSAPAKRYPILIAFLSQSLEELLDEAVELFDECLISAYNRSRNSLKRDQERLQEALNEKVRVLKIIGSIILDDEISNLEVRPHLYNKISVEQLKKVLDDCNNLVRPEHDKALDYFARRFSYLRQFTPEFLNVLKFNAKHENDPILCAVNHIKKLNNEGVKKLPAEVPDDFINEAWRKHVFNNGIPDRTYYELCTLWELRNYLRSGDVWVSGSRRYNHPDTYLIPKPIWLMIKPELCASMNLEISVKERLKKKQEEINSLYALLNKQIKNDPNLKIINGELIVTPIDESIETDSLKNLRTLISKKLPRVGLTDIVMEIESWLGLSECFYHAGNQKSNDEDYLVYLYAAILSEATNLGPVAMAEAADLDYEKIIWYKNWYIRDETLNAARTKLVNFQHQQLFAKHFGDGKFSSSDGRRVPVAVRTRSAKAFVKYFAFETGLNFYSWTSNQYSQYGNKVSSPTMREATLVLDAIIDNETELNIERHTTDTAGYTEKIFTIFDLLNIVFDPRIKSLGDQKIYYIGEKIDMPNIDTIVSGAIDTKLIENDWDEVLRLIASFKKGYVSVSLFISKLQSLPRKNNLAKALQEYGKIPKTISILKYALSEQHRRDVTTQLNKGEAVHDLQQFLHLGREGKIYAKQPGEQECHFGCLNLLINMVIVWNTVYMAETISQLQNDGYKIIDDDLKHLSPARKGHINPYGKFQFKFADLNGNLRALRES